MDKIDFKSLYPDSIILGQRRGHWLELLEPSKNLVYYQNTETSEFTRKMPSQLQPQVKDKKAVEISKKQIASKERTTRQKRYVRWGLCIEKTVLKGCCIHLHTGLA